MTIKKFLKNSVVEWADKQVRVGQPIASSAVIEIGNGFLELCIYCTATQCWGLAYISDHESGPERGDYSSNYGVYLISKTLPRKIFPLSSRKEDKKDFFHTIEVMKRELTYKAPLMLTNFRRVAKSILIIPKRQPGEK